MLVAARLDSWMAIDLDGWMTSALEKEDAAMAAAVVATVVPGRLAAKAVAEMDWVVLVRVMVVAALVVEVTVVAVAEASISLSIP